MNALFADAPMRTTVNCYISYCEKEASSAPEYGENRVNVRRKSVKEKGRGERPDKREVHS